MSNKYLIFEVLAIIMVSEVKITENEVVGMHTYRYFVLNDKEYYEIWEGETLLKSVSSPFCEGVLDLLYFHPVFSGVASNIYHYKYLAGEYYKRQQAGTETENVAPNLQLNCYPFLFVMDTFAQYRDNKADIPPEEHSWFDFDYSKTELGGHSETLESILQFAKNTFDSWADEKALVESKAIAAPLHIVLEDRNGEIVEVLHPQNLNELIYYIVLKANQQQVNKKLWIIRCNRCQRVFPNFKHGRSVLYCNFKDSNGESCRDIVKQHAEGWNKSEQEKELQKTYIRYYDEQRRKRKKKLATKEQIAIWSKNARAVRDRCINGEISEEDFVEWLESNKENYTEVKT